LTDGPTIGLVLCRAKNRIIAEYALRDIDKPIGVAELLLARLEDVGLSRQRLGPCVRGSRHPAVIPQELCRCRRRYSNKQADRPQRTVGGWQIVPSRALGLPRHVLTQHPVHS
jgi:hypothetical protein